MSKYIKLEDIRNALVELIKSDKWLERDTTMNIIKALGNLPTIEIVHCKDCKAHYDVDKNPAHIMCGYMSDNDFCSYGERIDNE